MSNGSQAFGKTAKLGIGLTSLFGALGAVFRVRSPQRPHDTESSDLRGTSRFTLPKPRRKVTKFLVLLGLVLLVVLASATVRALTSSGGCAAPTITWVGNASTEPDSWHTASNWDANRVPGAGDHVCISNVANTDAIAFSTGATTSVASLESEEALNISAGTLELTSATEESKVNNLTLSGGTLSGVGNLTILAGGNATWSGGHMTGTGRTLISGGNILEPAATLSITGSSDKALREGRVLENAGEVTFSGNYIANGTGAVIENSGSFDIKGDGDIPYVYGGTKTRFENTGTVKKSSGTATSDISASLDNDGSVDTSTGTLDLSGGTDDLSTSDTSTGDFAAASGAILRFGGNHRLSGGGSSLSGAGTVEFSGGTTNVGVDSYSSSGATSIAGGNITFSVPVSTETLNVSGGGATFNTASTANKINLSGGTLGGNGTVRVPSGGNASWSGGHMTGTGRTLISGANGSEPAATLSVTGSSDKALREGRVLENAGEVTFSGNYIANGTGAVIENSGSFDIKGDGDIPYVYGGTKTRFENTGTLKKTSGTASTDISASLDNDGSVEVSSGTFDLPGGSEQGASESSSGDFLAGEGATLRFSGEHRLSGAGSSVSGTGTVSFPASSSTVAVEDYDVSGTTSVSGATVDFDAPAKTHTLDFSAGILRGSSTLSVPAGGTATWSGGHMTGTGRTTVSGASGSEPAATLSVSGTSDKALREGRVLENAGTTTLSGNYIANGTGAVIENSGIFDIKGDGDLPYVYGGTKTRFENTGTLKKTLGTSNTEISASLDNDGSVEVNSGTLKLLGGTNEADSSHTSAGDFSAAPGTKLEFGGNHRLSGLGSSVTGTGTVEFSGGNTDVGVDSYSTDGTTAISGGNITFSMSTTTKAINVTGGAANFNKQLDTTTLDLSGGTLGGSGNVTVPAGGNATWSGGHMTGAGRTVISGANSSEPAATLSVSGTSDKALREGRVLENAGTTTLSGNYIANGTGAVIENSGIFDIKGDGDLPYVYGGTKTRFENTGTLKKTSAGTDSTDIGATVANTGGTVDVTSGTLNLTGGLDNFSSTGGVGALAGGTYMIRSHSVLKFTGADIDANAATIVLDGLGSAIVDQNNSDAIDNLSQNDGNFTIRSDRDLKTVGALTNEGSVTIGTGSVLTTTGEYVQATGSTMLEDTTSKLAASGARVQVQDGVMKGLGTVEPALEATGGRVEPGLSPGILKVAGRYEQRLSGTLKVEIGGAAPDSGHDQLDVGTTASLGGTLDIVTPSGFTPTRGESFTILKCGADTCRSGQFDTVQGTNVGPGKEYQVRYNATDVTLELGNEPPEAQDDSYDVNEDNTLNVDAPGVLANDTDVDNTAAELKAVQVTGPAHGTLTLNDNGSFSYTPNADFFGDDSFTYKANDGTDDSDTATVSITVNAVNDAPKAVNDSYSVNEDGTLNVADGANDVLSNDTDAENNTLTAAHVAGSGPAHGTLTFNANGSFTYTPDANFNGTDSFKYKANDGTTDSNEATVNITVNAANDAPEAAFQPPVTTNEDTNKVITLSASDVDGDNLTFAIVSGPTNGTLGSIGTVNCTGTAPKTCSADVTYTPNNNYNGSDHFTFKANDGIADSFPAPVFIRLDPVNDEPVATDDTKTMNEDGGPLSIDFGALVSDVETSDANLTYNISAPPAAQGSLSGGPGPTRNFTPAANFNGTVNIDYTVTDRGDPDNCGPASPPFCTATKTSAQKTVTITVNAVNDTPVAQANTYSTDEDTTLNVAAPGVLGNDSDADGDSLTATKIDGPAHGTLTLNNNGSFEYKPEGTYHGPDAFTYKATDGQADSDVVTASITVNSVNDKPTADAQSVTTDEDIPKDVTLTGNDVDGDSLTYDIVDGPAHGQLSGTGATRTYTPDENYHGPDSFTYKVNDGTVDSETAEVSITVTPVNDAPVADDQSLATDEDTAKDITLSASDLENDTLSYSVVAGPEHGTLSGTGANVTYTPDADFFGEDSFTFRASDGNLDSNVATVSITVNAVNDAPVPEDNSYTTPEDTPLNIGAPGLLGNDTDVEQDPLHVADGNANAADGISPVSGPANGTVELHEDGSFTYTPNTNYHGTDSFDYQVCDNGSPEPQCSVHTATVNVTIDPVNDAPEAANDANSTDEDTTLNVAVPGVLGNDTDVEDDPLTAVKVTDPAHGTLTLDADGSYTYTPNTNFNGTDSFKYKANDGTTDSNEATVTITVNAVNDAPVAANDTKTTNEDTPLTFPSSDLVSNDDEGAPDEVAQDLTVTQVFDGTHGTVSLGTDGNITFTPEANFNGPATFTYRVCDNGSPSECSEQTATVNVTVNAVNDPPEAQGDTLTTDEDTVGTGNVLSNDTDVDNANLTAVLANGPSHGTLDLNDDGSYTYTPAEDYNGPDSFTYNATDGTDDSNVATVSITVNAVNDAPVAVDDTATTPEDTAVEILASYLFKNDSTGPANESDQTLRISAVSGATNGQAELNGAGNVLFTPAPNFNGLASFDYTVCDNGTPEKCYEATATVQVTVSAVNDAPVAEAQSVTTDEDMAKDITLGASDVENDTLSFSVVAGPEHGTLSGTDANLTYKPADNYHGPDSFTFKANDGDLDSEAAEVSITVNSVNDAPVAEGDSYDTNQNTALNVAVPGVLANDNDLDGDSFTAELVSGPSHGQLTLNANGSFTYNPALNYNGPDSFSYTANDGTDDSNVATVSITVKPVVDTTAPTVDNVHPSDGQAGVSTTTDITVTFSEKMDESTLNDNTVKLVKPGRKPTSIPMMMTKTTDGSGRTVLTLNPFGSAKQNLAGNTTYQLTIEGAGDGDTFAVKDLAGNQLALDAVSSFTTARK